MASQKSLGTLTIDIVARVGGFVQGMDKAERQSRKWRRQVEKDLKVIQDRVDKSTKAAAAATVAATAAITALTKKGLDAVSAQATLARSLDTTFDSVTALQMAFSDAGIDGFESSINRLNRRLGAAELGRGAALKAVEELNLNLKELAELDVDERLAVIADRIVEVSENSAQAARYAQDLGFEQKEAAQFFVQGGDAIRAYREEVDRFGLALSAIDAIKVEQATAEFARTRRTMDAVSQQLAVQVAPLLGSVSSLFLEAAQEAGGMGSAVETTFDKAVIGSIRAAAGFRGVFNQVRDSLNDIWKGFQSLPPWAQEVGIAGAMLGGKKGVLAVAAISKVVEDTKVTAAWFAALTEGDISFGEWAAAGSEEARERLKELGHDIDGVKAKASGPSIIKTLFGPGESGNEWADEMIARYRRLQEEAEEAARTAAELAVNRPQMGLIDDDEDLERATKAQEAYAALLRDLRTEEEKLTDQLRERLAVLDAMKDISDEERRSVAARIAGAAISDAPQFSGLAPEIGGAFGELTKINEAEAKLSDWYSTQLDMLEQFRRERADLAEAWDAEELALKRRHEDELLRIEQARSMAQLAAAEGLFGDLADITKTFAGEQSGVYRTMFALQKAASLAQSAMAIQTGIAMAAANPFPMNLGAMATVAAATANIVGNIAAIGMAHDGIDKIPQTGTWLLEKGERVTTAETSAKLDRTLDQIQRNMVSGSRDAAPIINVTESAERAGSHSARQVDGRWVIDLVVANIRQDGAAGKAIRSAFGLQRVGR